MRKTTILILLSIFFFSQNASAQIDRSNYQLLWEISGNELTQPSYIFGSIHLRDKAAFDFPDSLLLILEACDAFANELHFDSMMRKEILAMRDNPKMQDLLDGEGETSRDGFSTKVNSTEEGMPTIVDAYLFNIAKEQGKAIFGLEKLEDQKEHMDQLEEGGGFFSSLFQPMGQAVLNVYQKGDLEIIEDFFVDDNDALMVRRNIQMVQSMKRIMHQKSLFAVVGTAHLPGKEGILELLKKEGYTLRPVTATFTGKAAKYTYEPIVEDWFKTEVPSGGFSFETPLEAIELGMGAQAFDLHISIDLGAGLFFYATNFEFGYDSDDMETFYKNMETNWQEGKGAEILLRKDSVFEVGPGRMYNLRMAENEIPFMMIRLIRKKGMVYMLMIGALESVAFQSPKVERFFDSFEISFENNLSLLSEKTGAYEVSFPHPNNYQRLKTPNPSLEEGAPYILHIYRGKDFQSGSTYLSRYNNFPNGTFLENEKDLFEGTKTEFTGRFRTAPSEDRFWEIDGYPARTYLYEMKGTYAEVNIAVRGNRTYLLIQLGDGAPDPNFMKSFHFKPFQKIQLEHQNLDSCRIKIWMPPDLLIKIDSTISQTDPEIAAFQTYVSTDTMTGTCFSVEHFLLSKYFYHDHPDSLLNDYMEELSSNYGDSLMNSKALMYQGKYPARTFQLNNNFTNVQQQFLIFLRGKSLYALHIYAAKELIGDPQLESFFDKVEFLDAETSSDELWESKTKLVLTDLLSEDTTTAQRAAIMLEYLEIQEGEMPMVMEALQHDYGADSSAYLTYVNLLLEKIHWAADSTMLPFLKKYYHEHSTHKEAILRAISNQEFEAAYPLFFELSKNLTAQDTLENSYQLMRPFADSLDLFEKYYPEISKLCQREELLYWYFSTSANYLKDTTVDARFILEHLEDYKKIVRRVLQPENVEEQTYRHRAILEFYNNVPMDEEMIQQLYAFGAQPNLWTKEYALDILLENGQTDVTSIAGSLLRDTSYLFSTILILQNHKALHLVDEQWLQPERVGVGVLYDHLFYYYDLLSFKFIKTVDVQFEGRTGKMYCYGYTIEKEDETTSKRLGIAGPFFEKGPEKFTDKLTNFTEEDLTGADDLDEKFAELLHEAFSKINQEE